MNKSKEYVINTIILLIGKFATQFITLFMLPLYTRYLETGDYGLVDLYQTYISLFVPVCLLCLDSAVFRFLIDERKNEEGKKTIINSALNRTIKQTILFLVIFSLLGIFIEIKYYFYIVFAVVTIMFSNISLQICRGLGKNVNYSIGCIISSLTTLITNLILILGFNYGANSILISTTLGNLLCIIYLFYSNKLYKYLNLNYKSPNKIKQMLGYSIPLIPNALSWWIVNASDRTIISLLINTAANGVYTVSCKFSNILNSIFSIFTMSWQESASLHIEEDDRDEFFSSMITNIYQLFACISLFIIVALPFVFNILIGNDYSSSYNYIPILIIANTFNVLIGLFGGVYVAKKLTKKMTSTTIVAAIINIIINISLIKMMGLYAACLSTLIAYLCMAIYRYFDVQKYVKVKIKIAVIIGVIIGFIISLISYYSNNTLINIIGFIIVFIYCILVNKKNIITLKNIFLKKIKKGSNNVKKN